MVMCSEPTMRAPFSGFSGAVLLAQRHQARHFGFGDIELLAAEIGQLDIGDDIVLGSGHVIFPKVSGSGRDRRDCMGAAIAGKGHAGNTI
jgi:hypothetical protein